MSFAPGHISLTFAIWDGEDELSKGSTGIGLIIPQGVHCAIEKSKNKKNRIIRKGKEVDDLVTLRAVQLLGFNDKGLVIYQRHDLPLGSGFGISGASALAACLELEKDIDKCVKASHQAEVEFNTGLGDVVAIAESIRKTSFPSIIIRETPGYLGKVTCVPITEKFVVCISGLGRNTSEIISDKSWIEIINSAALGIQYNNVSLRSAIKIGRLFTERTGLINENISQMIDTLPLGSVSSIAHLGTSIVATSDDIPNLIDSLHKFGDVREY
ncbi:MAG: hypothetical protein CMB06_01495 [Euryarchaeota archaeon]|nr:hypothetical protein [Euryarchaeota archaeon]|tara:strand:+ start:352 stop:1161 length:810 start_codon:yes stop_codon:yes gene_type:complete